MRVLPWIITVVSLIMAVFTSMASPDTPEASTRGCGGAGWAIPVEGTYVVTSEFGYRADPINGGRAFHSGLDMAAPVGTPILAAASGKVTVSAHRDTGTGYGLYVVVDTGDGTTMLYGHMSAVMVNAGDQITVGSQIGTMGSTGRSTGSHLHFEVRKNSEPIDPRLLLEEHGLSVDGTPSKASTSCGTVTSGDPIVAAAQAQIGLPYSWGGGSLTGPSEGFGSGAGVVGFDCSGLVRYAVYQGTGVVLPRVVADQLNAVDRIPLDQVQAGDLLFVNGTTHIAIADGQGGLIHAPQPGENVTAVSDYKNSPYWRGAIWAAGRVKK